MGISRKTRRTVQHGIAVLSLAMFFLSGAALSGQSTMPQNTMPQGGQVGDNDTTRWQIARMDEFLDAHPEIAESLRRDPSLINNQQFIQGHPALQDFLQQHSGIREEFTENPQAFMRREERFDRREDRGAFGGDSDTTRGELARMDQFMDSHPEISEQLRRDPSLINNKEFVDKHPALQEFLQQHSGIREEFRENPQAFMRAENRFDRHEDRGNFRDNDTTRWQLSVMDQFLDSHPEVEEQLRRDPSLINNAEFVKNHPALQEFLQQHSGVREEFTENPQAFMHQERRYEHQEERLQLGRMDQFLDSHREIEEQLQKDPSLINNKQFIASHPALQEFLQKHSEISAEFKQDPQAFMRREERFDRHEDRWNQQNMRRAEVTNFGQFLSGHSLIGQQLSKDPSLVANKEYLESHAELRDYLNAHPELKQQITQNPQAVMSDVQSGASTTGKATVAAKVKKGSKN